MKATQSVKDDYMTIGQACEYLGIKHYKFSLLVAEGRIETFTDSLDKRQKLVNRASVEAIKSGSIQKEGNK